jgi:hypothetical protein
VARWNPKFYFRECSGWYAELVLRIIALLLLSLSGLAAADFSKWWPQFQAAVANGNAKAVAHDAHFPMDWENGPIRKIKTEDDFMKRFDVYFTPEIRKAIASGKPAPLAPGEYGVTWKARGNEYTIMFKPEGDAYALTGLSEGPP